MSGGVPSPDADECLDSSAPCVEADLGWALGVVFQRYVRETDAVLCDVPGGPRGYQVLAKAGSDAPRRQLALAQHLGIDRTVMTYLLDDLAAAGLIERRADPTDRRARLVAVTEKGRRRVEAARRHLGALEVQILGGLTDVERAAFRSMLQRVARHLDAGDPVVGACDVVEELAGAGSVHRTGTNPDS